MHIPSFKLISQSTLKKVRKTRTDGRTDGQCHSIIRPFFKRAYKNDQATQTFSNTGGLATQEFLLLKSMSYDAAKLDESDSYHNILYMYSFSLFKWRTTQNLCRPPSIPTGWSVGRSRIFRQRQHCTICITRPQWVKETAPRNDSLHTLACEEPILMYMTFSIQDTHLSN